MRENNFFFLNSRARGWINELVVARRDEYSIAFQKSRCYAVNISKC